MGAIVAIIRQQNVFSLFAMIGGAVWATGNLCTVPIVKCIGLARGLLVWGVTNMITGWFVSLMGLLGQPPAQITNRFMNYLGVIFCVSCVFISSFIMNEAEEKEDIPRRVSSVGNLSTAVISVSNDPEPLIPVTDNGTSWVDRLSSSQRKLVGYGLSIFAGLMYGVNFDPCDYAWRKWYKDSYQAMDMEFSQFCGILLASFFYLCCYCIYKKNKPDVYVKSIFPGFLSGLMWGIAQTGWFFANASLGPVISFPIICCGPTIVSSIWGMTLYKEITGKRNTILLVVLVIVMLTGSILVGCSKK